MSNIPLWKLISRHHGHSQWTWCKCNIQSLKQMIMIWNWGSWPLSWIWSHRCILRDSAKHWPICLCSKVSLLWKIFTWNISGSLVSLENPQTSPWMRSICQPRWHVKQREGNNGASDVFRSKCYHICSHCRLWRSVWLLTHHVCFSDASCNTTLLYLVNLCFPNTCTKCLRYSATQNSVCHWDSKGVCLCFRIWDNSSSCLRVSMYLEWPNQPCSFSKLYFAKLGFWWWVISSSFPWLIAAKLIMEKWLLSFCPSISL